MLDLLFTSVSPPGPSCQLWRQWEWYGSHASIWCNQWEQVRKKSIPELIRERIVFFLGYNRIHVEITTWFQSFGLTVSYVLFCVSVFLWLIFTRSCVSIFLYLLSPNLVVGAMSYISVFDCDICGWVVVFLSGRIDVHMCVRECVCVRGGKKDTLLSRHLSCASLA